LEVVAKMIGGFPSEEEDDDESDLSWSNDSVDDESDDDVD
jgi:hypothetical protein